MRILFVLLLSFYLLPSDGFAAPVRVTWVELVDDAAQNFEDPFRELSASTLANVSSVVRLREQLQGKSLDVDADLRTSLQARLRLKENSLIEQGIDFDQLLSKRWSVAKKRKAAAWATNPLLEGHDVSIRGYFLLGRDIANDRLAAYLVPAAGMCSHMPPPSPNQLLRLHMPDDAVLPNGLYTPVEILGELDISQSNLNAHVVDGVVSMKSAWVLRVREMKSLLQLQEIQREKALWPRTVTR